MEQPKIPSLTDTPAAVAADVMNAIDFGVGGMERQFALRFREFSERTDDFAQFFMLALNFLCSSFPSLTNRILDIMNIFDAEMPRQFGKIVAAMFEKELEIKERDGYRAMCNFRVNAAAELADAMIRKYLCHLARQRADLNGRTRGRHFAKSLL